MYCSGAEQLSDANDRCVVLREQQHTVITAKVSNDLDRQPKNLI